MKREECTIFIVDDDVSLCRALARLLKTAGFSDIQKFSSAEEFLSSAPEGSFPIMILDFSLPGKSGTDLIRHLRASGSSFPVILISAHEAELARAGSLEEKPYACLHKPFGENELLSVIQSLLDAEAVS